MRVSERMRYDLVNQRVHDAKTSNAHAMDRLSSQKEVQKLSDNPIGAAQIIRYRDQITRWGSCTAEGHLSFSWRLIMAPPLVLDYLAAHEVAHLAEMNHSRRFWQLCRSLAPETETARAWLAAQGPALHAIGADEGVMPRAA